MAATTSPKALTSKFITQFTSKLTSSGLMTLLESHVQQKDADFDILQMDPSILELHIELLAYENAIKVACDFPSRLAERLGQSRGKAVEKGVKPVPKEAPVQSPSSTASQTAEPVVNGSVARTESYQLPPPPAIQAVKPVGGNDTPAKIGAHSTSSPSVGQAAKQVANDTARKTKSRQESSRNSTTPEPSLHNLFSSYRNEAPSPNPGTKDGSKSSYPSY
ncbi:uncharacterized protein Z520_08201 [Fonsecaea multimorphosa CBS 102226]|uniref:Uncharacterized protein n=1 Tax=Fonsecaea multimorphosa CBS 102226 TaxID=1442371 RepID=A0A0D2IFW2_9EURO|nr:uncharacterized protein Z520_08201 [Fonsecaea multimorphosa CBS 102226]KIX95946.1 hypothetical protein Z520_08201 [Fonsecaea multimorphosa CBS 102226]OAL21717.1 hypothetical protein AYO22_07659 [Fonsecaea multimorphosa]